MKKRIYTNKEIRDGFIKRMWPSGKVPSQVTTIYDDDLVVVFEKISKIYVEERLKEFAKDAI